MNLKEICLKVCDLTRQTGKMIVEEREKLTTNGVSDKGTNDFVTVVDKLAEETLVKHLSEILPEAGFIAEEGTAGSNGEEYNWVVDPIDGTTNFIHGVMPFATSIGLLHNNKLVMGVVYEITQQECFYAFGDGKAYMNGKEIRASKAKKISDCLIATGFPYSDYDKLKGVLAAMEYFIYESHGIRRLGSAATDIAYVACGRLDAFYEHALSPWDVAGGAFVAQEAGAIVSDFKGGDDYIFGKEFVAATANVHTEFIETLQKHM